MSKELIVNATSLESRLAILEEDLITEIFIERQKNKGILGNIYKGKVTKVLPGMQAAFVDIGLERHAFLYVTDFLEDYEEYEELFGAGESIEIEAGRIQAKAEAQQQKAEAIVAPVERLEPRVERVEPRVERVEPRVERVEKEEIKRPVRERERPAERPERTDRPTERADRPTERADRQERGERPDRGDRGERGERADRGDRKKPRRDQMRESRDQGRFGRREDRPEPRSAPFEPTDLGPKERTIEPLPGESFAHLSEQRQIPSAVESERAQPETLAVWNPLFQELAGPPELETAHLEAVAESGSPVEAPPSISEETAKEAPPAEAFEAERSRAESGLWADLPEARVEEPPSEEKPVRERSKREQARAEEPVAQEASPSGEAETANGKAEAPPEPSRRELARRAREERRQERAREKQAEAEAAARAQADALDEAAKTIIDYQPDAPKSDQPAEGEARVEEKPDVQELVARSGEANRKRRPSGGSRGRPQIGDLLREGQEILVQIAKEPIGKKGARITSHVALPGRYLVYMPTVDHVGVSRKISTDAERQRLKEIITRLRGDFGKGFIVRTAGEGHSEQDFRSDMTYLTRLWEDVRAKAERGSAPALVHSEPSLVQRVVRDYFNDDFRAIRVDDEQEYERIVDFVSKFNPELVSRVRLYNKTTPIFDHYGVSAELEKALRQKVWLKNGGYIVLNQTEALVAIDVNTGKFVGSTNSLEDTITRTNLDAVKEVVRQIRLRDLGGIIVIDFIDMDERRNRQKVMEALQAELSKDKSPSKILQFNEFGLVAITRKRVKQSLERTLCQPCLFCSGTGLTKSVRTVSYLIHQEVRKMIPHLQEGDELIIRCHPDVSKALKNGEREVLAEIEEMTGKIVTVKPDPLMHIEQFDVVEG